MPIMGKDVNKIHNQLYNLTKLQSQFRKLLERRVHRCTNADFIAFIKFSAKSAFF